MSKFWDRDLSARFSPRLGRNVLRGAVLAAASVTLAACASSYSSPYTGSTAPTTVQERYPIAVERQLKTLEISVSPGAQRLSPSERARVTEFVGDYRRTAGGVLIVEMPSGTRNEAAALSVLLDVREVLQEFAVPDSAVEVRTHGNGTRNPPIRMRYEGFQAVTSDCGVWPKNLSSDYSNRPYANFGCAYQRNIAAMAANPRDLQQPRAMDPAPAERRDTVRGKYIAGESTATNYGDEAGNASISEVGQ
jgi:pilus assembly protein CpaD